MASKLATIALLGAPNSGKSTLANYLVGSKISIVTPKVQTTRNAIKAILTEDDTQLVFIDTPGIFVKAKSKLEKFILQNAWDALEEASELAVLIDAKRGLCHHTEYLLDALSKKGRHAILILNKIDLVSPETLLPLAKTLNERFPFTESYMISAEKGKGVADLVTYFKRLALPSPWMFDPDQLSDAPLRFLAAEITREQLFFRLKQELPYQLSVETDSWKEEGTNIVIHQTIYIAKASQKAIILGKAGHNIKATGKYARIEMQKLVEGKVHLYLHVKVKEMFFQ